MTGTDLDPGVVLREWPGRVGARVRADAAVEGENFTVALHELKADGRLRDRPIELSARGGYAADTLRIDALTLRSGSTDVSARGTAGSELALEWRVESPDLGEVWPQLEGRLSASGELRGPRERPRVEVERAGKRCASWAPKSTTSSSRRRRRRRKSSFVARAQRIRGGSAGRRDSAIAVDRRGQRRASRARAVDHDERRRRELGLTGKVGDRGRAVSRGASRSTRRRSRTRSSRRGRFASLPPGASRGRKPSSREAAGRAARRSSASKARAARRARKRSSRFRSFGSTTSPRCSPSPRGSKGT